ncbi:MAG: MFS transporter [Kamptonema sp. SIO4C4]|nr:MFS transporter [Kamptonema sp. SIO4C4]
MVTPPTSLRKFFIIWVGQLASTLGSTMTTFALTLWAWEATGQATPLSLLFFFTYTPKVIAAVFAGVIVDRFPRKYLIMLGDTVAGMATLVLLLLFLTGHLQIWHLYIAGAISGLSDYLQRLAYSASMTAIVPQRHYARATALRAYVTNSGSEILGPALAGLLYTAIGLGGILTLDIVTFLIAVGTVGIVTIPQQTPAKDPEEQHLWQELTFGFRYIFARPSLLAILIFLLSINLVGNAGGAIFPAMILARSGDSAAILATVQAATGIGGITGAVVLSLWGGPKRRIHGLLLGQTLARISGIILGLGRLPWIWVTAGLGRAFFAPFLGSSNQAIWLSKVDPAVQGKVFSARYLIAQITSPLGLAIAGPLADYVFEPAMQPSGGLAGVLGGIFGTGEGSGMALQYTLFSLLGSAVGLGGYFFPILRDVEKIVPDYQTTQFPEYDKSGITSEK